MTQNIHQNMEEAEGIVIDFAAIFRALIRNASLIIACALLGGLMLMVRTDKNESYSYTASVMTYVTNKSPDIEVTSIAQADTTAAQALIKVYSNVISKNDRFLSEVLLNAGLDQKYKIRSLGNAISASPVTGTQLMNIKVTMKNPKDAFYIAQAIEKIGPTLLPMLIDGSSISVVSSAVFPTASVTKNLKKSIIMGALLGALIGIIGVIAIEILDRRVKSSFQVKLMYDHSVLGEIPAAGKDYSAGNQAVRDAWRNIRTKMLRKLSGKEAKVMTLTGPDGKEGVSSAAQSLAIAFGEIGRKCVVLDGSLRKGSSKAGLTDVVTGACGLSDVITKDESGVFDRIFAGTKAEDPTGILEVEAFDTLMEELTGKYDFVLIDAPSALKLPETLIFTGKSDCTAVVVRNGRTRIDHIGEMVRELKGSGTDVIGIIYNEAGDCVL